MAPIDFGKVEAPSADTPVVAAPGTPENPLHTLYTIPNLITALRLLLTIAFVFLYPIEALRIPAVVIFIIAATTDWFDGQIARRFNQVSVFGKRFDPIMDRVLIFSGLIALVITGRLPLWVIVFLAARDIYLFCGSAIVYHYKQSIIDVCYVGKACTFILMTGFAMLLLDLFVVPGLGVVDVAWLPGFNAEHASLGIFVVYVGCVLSFTAAAIYTFRGIRTLAIG